MRTLSKCLGALLMLAAVALPLGFVLLMGLAWYCTDHQPTVTKTVAPPPAHVERARRLVERNDPRQTKSGTLRTITLTQDELDLVLDQLVQRAMHGNARTQLQQDQATVQASLPLPSNPFGGYLNIEARLLDTGTTPQLAMLRLGRLQLPQPVSDLLLRLGLRWLQQDPLYGPAADVVQRVQITPQMFSVVYAWSGELPEALRASQLEPAEVERLRLYQARLADASVGLAPGPGLHQLLQPLLELAAKRSSKATDDAALAQEQRAALVVLAFYVNGKGLAAVVPAASDWPAPQPHRAQLGGRADLAQHFSVSAAMAATAGTPLANAVGLYKELQDGSGFSLAELAADRAGTRLGALAVGPVAAQERLQRRLAAGLVDQDLLPPLRDLPEFLQEAEFKRRYGEVGSPAYKRMQADIERRVGALALYR